MKLHVVPCTLEEANAFVEQFHRHCDPVVAHRFCAAAAQGDKVVGVYIAGNPNSRCLVDGFTFEALRVATDGTQHASSLLYAACWRAGRELGYRRMVSYTLKTEPGTSLRAMGMRVVAEVKARSWHTPTRPRVDKRPLQDKLRWEMP